MAKSALLKSSIAKKYWMALTGLFLCLFLAGHLAGNLQLLVPNNALNFNQYALFMTSNPAVKLLSYLTYISIIFHAIDGIYLAIQNQKARPVAYAMSNPSKNSSFSSRNMAVLGTIILVFISTHMINFWAKMHFDANMPLVTKVQGNQGQSQSMLIGTPDSKIQTIPLPPGGSLKTLVDQNNNQPGNTTKLVIEGSNVVKDAKTGEVLFIGFKDDAAYIVVNGSNKIEVVNTMIPWDCVVEYVSVYNELVDTFGHQEAHDNAIAYAQACVKKRFGVE